MGRKMTLIYRKSEKFWLGKLLEYPEIMTQGGDPALFAAALGDIARAKGMIQFEGLGHDSLYKTLSPEGNPDFSTVFKIIQALGLRLHAGTA